MRMSTIDTDPGYDAWLENAPKIQVSVDGVEIHDVIMFDDELGEALVLSRDSEGHMYWDGDEIATHTVKGAITYRVERI